MPVKVRLFASASFLIPVAIYLLTICPTIFVGDSGELILSASRLEVSHPPGYPFFTMIGRLFSLLPLSNLAFRFNLLSALLTALSSLLLFLAVHSALTKRGDDNDTFGSLVSLSAALVWAFGYSVWSQAVIAEVYPMGGAIIAGLLLFTFLYLKDGNPRYLLLSAVLIGIGLCHHLSFLALLPGMILIVWKKGLPSKKFRLLGLLVVIVAVYLTSYFYMPIRSRFDLLIDWNNPETVKGLYAQLTARQFQLFIASPTLFNIFKAVCKYFILVWDNLTPLGFIISLGMWLYLCFSHRVVALFTLIVSVFNLALSGLYDIIDLDVYLYPTYAGLALCWGVGLFKLSSRLSTRRRLRLLPPVAALLLPAILIMNNWSVCDRSEYLYAEEYGKDILDPLPAGSVFFTSGDNINAICLYLRHGAGYRRDLEVIGRLSTLEYLKRKVYGDSAPEVTHRQAVMEATRLFPGEIYFAKELIQFVNQPIDYSKLNLEPAGLSYRLVRDGGEVNRHLLWERIDFTGSPKNIQEEDIKTKMLFGDYILAYCEDLLEDGRREEALTQVEAVRELLLREPESRLHNSLGVFLKRYGFLQDAEEEYELALRSSFITTEERSNLFTNIGNLRRAQGGSDEAIERYTHALELNPQNQEALYNMALVKGEMAVRQRDYRSAISHFSKALEVDPSEAALYFNIGLIYSRELKDFHLARKNFHNCIRFAGGTELAERAQQELEKLPEIKGEP